LTCVVSAALHSSILQVLPEADAIGNGFPALIIRFGLAVASTVLPGRLPVDRYAT